MIHTFTRFICVCITAALCAASAHSAAQVFLRNYSIPVEVNGLELTNPWAGGLNSCQFSEMDFNDDGKQDLFVFDRVGNRISTFINESAAAGVISYRYTREYQSVWPAELRNWVFLRDFNCDGKQDIVSNNQSGIRIWFNTSDGGNLSFTPANGGALIQAYYDIGSNPFDGPIYAISVDLPSFVDYDNDGDIDIFSFTETSVGMYFFKSMQVENGNCTELDFICANRCYGKFNESPESFTLFTGDEFQCDFNVNDPRGAESGSRLHTGGTILQLDLDQNGILDLVLGDVTEPNLAALELEEDVDGLDSTVFSTLDFPALYGGSDPVNINLFPGAFYLDVDHDGLKDLIIGPNSGIQAADRRSVWRYRNTGLNDLPVFEFEQDDFLQEDMIDLGIGATPTVADVNADGLPDLVVANRESFQEGAGFTSRLHYFRNTGTPDEPAFELVDANWLNIPALELKSIHPAFGDIDGDGDDDLMIGDLNGFIHLFQNGAGPSAPMDFSASPSAIQDDTGLPVDVGQSATPQLIDYDDDGLPDLMTGERNGNVNFYKNTGTEEAYAFTLVEDTIGDIVATNLLGIFGFSVPHFFRNDQGEWELLLGTETGQINHFTDVVENTSGTATLVTSDFLGVNEGQRCAVFLADLNNDEYADMLIGQVGGGLGIYISLGDGVEDIAASNREWNLYPNPADALLTLTCDRFPDAGSRVLVFDGTGRIIAERSATSSHIEMDCSGWAAGVYLVRIGNWHGRVAVR